MRLGIDAEGLSSEDSDMDAEPVCHCNSDAPATVTSSDDSKSPEHQDGRSADSSGEESRSSGERPSTSSAPSEDSSEATTAPQEQAARASGEADSISSNGSAGEAEPAASSKEKGSKLHPRLAALPSPVSGGQCKQQAEATGPVVLEEFASAEELEALGLDRLKAALMERGMKCGGTLQERAQRLFSVKGVPLDKIDSSLLAKPSKGKKK